MQSSGVDPTLAALLPLIGVALGAMLGGLARLILDRKSEERTQAAEMRAAVRLLEEDLARISEQLERTPVKSPDMGAAVPTPESWPSVRVALARGLSEGQWDALRAAIYYLDAAAAEQGPLMSTGERVPLPGHHGRLSDAEQAVGQAREALVRFREYGTDDDWYPPIRLPRR